MDGVAYVGFWKLDEKLGPSRMAEGTTATIVFVSPMPSAASRARGDADATEEPVGGGGAVVTCAWVGDSQVMEVDMLEPKAKIGFLSEAHDAKNEAEVCRLKRHWRARARRRDGSSVAEAVAEVAGGDGDEPRADLTRAMAYEDRLVAVLDRAAPPGLERVDSTVGRRRSERSGQRTGPVVVESKWRERETGRDVVGSSTSVTRSIGDWDSSRALVPMPDVVERVVPDGAHKRYVLATDGLWNAASPKRVSRVAHDRKYYDDPQACADALLALVRESPRGFRDDTTVVVIDVRPARHLAPMVPPASPRGTPRKFFNFASPSKSHKGSPPLSSSIPRSAAVRAPDS